VLGEDGGGGVKTYGPPGPAKSGEDSTEKNNLLDGSTVLDVRDLKMHFPVKSGLLRRTVDYVKAVDGVSFSVGKRETLGLVGESGCGKTTVGKCIVRLLQPTDGVVLFEDRDVTNAGARDLRSYRKKVQMVFQDPYGSLNPRMTVAGIVGEGPAIMGQVSVDKRVREVLEAVGLPAEAATRYPHEFSGGQRQRIGIARALAMSPSFLVCDEPVSALDVSIQAQIINLLEDLQAQFSLSYLFVAHDLSVVRHIADRIVVMYVGKVMEESPTEELFARPHHPYTQALFSSIPSLDPTSRRGLKPLVGEPPSPAEPPPGCRFASRCPDAGADCREGEIGLVEVSPGHRVRCVRV
jgi:oligopeptide transport system ATP-binding protein